MKRLLMVAVLLVTTVGAWLAPGQAVSAQDGACPVPAIDLITASSRIIDVTIETPTAGEQQEVQEVIDVTGRGGQVLTFSFDSFISWGPSIGASTGQVLVDGMVVYTFTRTVESGSSLVSSTIPVTVPSGATNLTLTFTHTIDNPGETSGTGSYSFSLQGISLLTPEIPCPPSICDQAIAGEGDFAHYEVVYAPARGGAGSQLVIGGPGSDTLRGGSGHDLLCGLGGNDTLVGGSGNDILDGGDGYDTLKGQSGNDTLLNGEDNNGGSGN